MDCAALRDTRPQQVHEILAKAQRLGSDCFPKESSDVPSRSPDIAAMNEADRLIRKFRMAKKEPPTPPIIEDSRYSPLNEQRCKSSWGD